MNVMLKQIREMMKTKDAVSKILGYEASLSFFSLADRENIEERERAQKVFKVLFEHGYHDVLWNQLCDSANLDELQPSDFEAEEWEFIFRVREARDSYSKDDRKNINSTIETERLYICPFEEEHYALFEQHFAEQPLEFMNYTNEEFDKRACSMLFRTAPHVFTVYSKDEGTVVGYIALREISLTGHLFNLEYYIMPKYRRMGYGLEMTRALVKAAFANQLIERRATRRTYIYEEGIAEIELIEIHTSAENIASQSIAERLGFHLDGILKRRHIIEPLGKYMDQYRYSLEKKTERQGQM